MRVGVGNGVRSNHKNLCFWSNYVLLRITVPLSPTHGALCHKNNENPRDKKYHTWTPLTLPCSRCVSDDGNWEKRMLGQECLKEQNQEGNIRRGGKTVYVVFKHPKPAAYDHAFSACGHMIWLLAHPSPPPSPVSIRSNGDAQEDRERETTCWRKWEWGH